MHAQSQTHTHTLLIIVYYIFAFDISQPYYHIMWWCCHSVYLCKNYVFFSFMDSDFMYSPAPKQMRFNENTHSKCILCI